MDFKTEHIGSFGGRPANIVQLVVSTNNTTITEDITDLKGMIDNDIIQSLRNIADELEEHNQNTIQYTKLITQRPI